MKNHGYFVLVTLPALVSGCDFLQQKLCDIFKQRDQFGKKYLPIGVSIGVVFVSVIISIHVLNGYHYGISRSPHHMGYQINESALPVRACDFIKQDQKKGRILNNWDSGGYVSFATDLPAFIYGWNELMGEKLYLEYMKFKELKRLPAMLQKWQHRIALVPFNQIPQWFYFFETSKDWQCVYLDDRDAVFYHRSILTPGYPLVNKLDDLVQDDVLSPEEVDQLLQRASKMKMPSFLTSLTQKHYEPRKELRMTAVSLLRQDGEACIRHGLQGLQKSTFPAPEILLNLGHAYFAKKDFARSKICFEGALEWIDNAEARKRLAQMGKQLSR